MIKPKQGITVDEFMRQLESDPEFAKRKGDREQLIAKREAESMREQAALLEDLAAIGVNASTVWELVNTSASYSAALPVLLDHLKRSYSDGTREGIARALAVRATRPLGWSVLVDEYKKTESANKRVKDGLAVALAGASDDTVMSELIELAADCRHGASRVLLLLGIKRSKSPLAKTAIQQLSNDPDLEKEIASWRRAKRNR